MTGLVKNPDEPLSVTHEHPRKMDFFRREGDHDSDREDGDELVYLKQGVALGFGRRRVATSAAGVPRRRPVSGPKGGKPRASMKRRKPRENGGIAGLSGGRRTPSHGDQSEDDFRGREHASPPPCPGRAAGSRGNPSRGSVVFLSLEYGMIRDVRSGVPPRVAHLRRFSFRTSTIRRKRNGYVSHILDNIARGFQRCPCTIGVEGSAGKFDLEPYRDNPSTGTPQDHLGMAPERRVHPRGERAFRPPGGKKRRSSSACENVKSLLGQRARPIAAAAQRKPELADFPRSGRSIPSAAGRKKSWTPALQTFRKEPGLLSSAGAFLARLRPKVSRPRE